MSVYIKAREIWRIYKALLLSVPVERAVKDKTWHRVAVKELCMLAASAVKAGVSFLKSKPYQLSS